MKPPNLRYGYRLIVWLHPAPFRDRFGGEMLWIFDQVSGRRATARLLADGLLSLLRQHVRAEKDPQPIAAGFGPLDTGAGIPPRRFVEAGISASFLLAVFILLLGKLGKPLVAPACLPGTPRSVSRMLQAPARIQALPLTVANRHGPSNPGQVEASVASAVRIVQAQQRAASSATGYCSKN